MIEQVLNRELLETVLQQMEAVARAPVAKKTTKNSALERLL
jgi:hypothetical protein